MREFAWQYFEVVDEKTAIEAVAIFLFPDGVSPGGYPGKNATERVRIVVSRARKKSSYFLEFQIRPTLCSLRITFPGHVLTGRRYKQ